MLYTVQTAEKTNFSVPGKRAPKGLGINHIVTSFLYKTTLSRAIPDVRVPHTLYNGKKDHRCLYMASLDYSDRHGSCRLRTSVPDLAIRYLDVCKPRASRRTCSLI